MVWRRSLKYQEKSMEELTEFLKEHAIQWSTILSLKNLLPNREKKLAINLANDWNSSG